MAFVELIPLDSCRANGGTFVLRSGRELAVFLLSDPDRVFVIDNACPHASGNLAGGEVTGNVVACRWHHWEFDLATGLCVHSDRARVRRYPAEIRNGAVWADLTEETSA